MTRVVECLSIGLESTAPVSNSHSKLGLQGEGLLPILERLDKSADRVPTVPKVREDLATPELTHLGEAGMTDTLSEMENLLAEGRMFPVPWIGGLMPLKGGPRIRAEIFQKRRVGLLELRRFHLVRQLQGPACAIGFPEVIREIDELPEDF